MIRVIILSCAAILFVACSPKQLEPDADFVCDNCARWNETQDPFRIYGNSWYVGTAGLSAILIETNDGLILIDGGLPQTAAIIVKNIQMLGFDPAQINSIFVSHAHYDHVGGVAALQRYTGATVYSSVAGTKTLSSGELQADDPQFAREFGAAFPAVANTVAVNDGDVLPIEGVSIEAVYTPGHTPGGMSWAWESCVLDSCYDLVYADSLTAVSADGYRFSDGPGAEQIIDSANTIAGLNCDILLTPHPFFFGMQEKLQKRDDGNPFVNNVACSIYAETALGWLEQRLRSEREQIIIGDDLLTIVPPNPDVL